MPVREEEIKGPLKCRHLKDSTARIMAIRIDIHKTVGPTFVSLKQHQLLDTLPWMTEQAPFIPKNIKNDAINIRMFLP